MNIQNKYIKTTYIFLFLLFLSITFLACSNTTNNINENIVFPDSKIDFTLQVQPFLKYNCAYSGCHSSFSKSAGLSLEDYFSIMSYPGLVIPNNPDASILNQILENRLPHTTYFYRGNITQNQIQGMRQWVLEGALLIPSK
jgi:hypothetical protein